MKHQSDSNNCFCGSDIHLFYETCDWKILNLFPKRNKINQFDVSIKYVVKSVNISEQWNSRKTILSLGPTTAACVKLVKGLPAELKRTVYYLILEIINNQYGD